MRNYFIALFTPLLTSCLGGDNSGSGPYAPVPDIQIVCPSAVNGCQQSQVGQHIHLGLIFEDDINAPCNDFLFAVSLTPPLWQHFDAFASTTAESHHQVIGLYALFSSWQGPLGQIVFSLERGNYRVCAFIDSNGNGRFDHIEPFAEATIQVGRDLMPEITNWTDF